MRWLSALIFSLFTLTLLGCGQKAASNGILDEISGVWGIRGESGLFSILYKDNKLGLLADDLAIPVTLGAIDDENKTVNLNVTLPNGKPGIWTLRQVWDQDKKSFHLQFIFHDGARSELTFVRKISTDDLNKIANSEIKVRSNAIAEAATATAKPPETPTSTPPPVEQIISTEVAEKSIQKAEPIPATPTAITWTPSFDCTKASTGPERLICSSKELSEFDVKLGQLYSSALVTSMDKEAFKNESRVWLKSVRNACSDVVCMAEAYKQRIAQLSR